MELLKEMEKLQEDEKTYFENGDTNNYYRYLISTDFFKSLEKKLDSDEKLTDDEWSFLLGRLYLVSCKSLMEEDSVALTDHFLSILGRLGMVLSKEKSPLYNECYKMREQIAGMMKLKEVNDDLFYGFEIAEDSRSEDDLRLLLKQHKEADTFRGNRNWFLEEYKEDANGVLTDRERIAINASNRAYDREKELVLRYNV